MKTPANAETSATVDRRRRPLIVASIWASTVIIAVGAGTYAPSVVATPHGSSGGDPLAAELGLLLVYATFATVGAVVALRRPRHPIGWLFLTSAWLLAAAALTHGYAHHAVLSGTTSTTSAQWAALLSGLLFLPPFVLLTMYLPLIFPDGRLLSTRWRVVVVLLAVAVATLSLIEALSPGPLQGFPEITNPLGVAGAAKPLGLAGAVVDPLFFPIVAAVAVSVVLRFRRASPSERQQFKWVALPAGVLLVFLPLNELFLTDAQGAPRTARDIVFFVAFAGLPVGLSIAVLRYRLYDIDRILSRTVTYATLSVVLVGIYVAVVVTLGTVMRALTGGTSSELVVAASTLTVAALFQPARRRIQRVVDRRFNRAHYDAGRTIERFGQRLRDELDAGTLLGEIRDIVATSMQPTSTSVWMAAPSEHHGDP